MTKQIVTGTLALVLVMLAAGCEDGLDGSGGSGVGGDKPTSGAGKSSQPFTAGSRLKVRQVAGADGSIQQLGLYDTELATACSFGLADDGSTRCLPIGALGGLFWADDKCTVPVGKASCGAPTFVTVAATTCGGATTVYQAGAPYTGATYFGGPGGSCLAQAAEAGLYATTGKLAAASFVQGTEETK